MSSLPDEEVAALLLQLKTGVSAPLLCEKRSIEEEAAPSPAAKRPKLLAVMVDSIKMPRRTPPESPPREYPVIRKAVASKKIRKQRAMKYWVDSFSEAKVAKQRRAAPKAVEKWKPPGGWRNWFLPIIPYKDNPVTPYSKKFNKAISEKDGLASLAAGDWNSAVCNISSCYSTGAALQMIEKMEKFCVGHRFNIHYGADFLVNKVVSHKPRALPKLLEMCEKNCLDCAFIREYMN
jgi:hypothetical protein